MRSLECGMRNRPAYALAAAPHSRGAAARHLCLQGFQYRGEAFDAFQVVWLEHNLDVRDSFVGEGADFRRDLRRVTDDWLGRGRGALQAQRQVVGADVIDQDGGGATDGGRVAPGGFA